MGDLSAFVKGAVSAVAHEGIVAPANSMLVVQLRARASQDARLSRHRPPPNQALTMSTGIDFVSRQCPPRLKKAALIAIVVAICVAVAGAATRIHAERQLTTASPKPAIPTVATHLPMRSTVSRAPELPGPTRGVRQRTDPCASPWPSKRVVCRHRCVREGGSVARRHRRARVGPAVEASQGRPAQCRRKREARGENGAPPGKHAETRFRVEARS
ncbi:hypothetical protein BamMEX5DRAFT_1636 [Burkholderia ambifaria MEX-5]|uniref:Uncharacterized protein n=1 Tax=Burkholderia ambifaria MEX-5 TaxID=396597 RepID=B1T1H0_9BURK|nr:hypothetical protein BamMEX5DRAFT_1636 [Burkholderia ambifaria MEX-5]